jgi:hypothetical protein
MTKRRWVSYLIDSLILVGLCVLFFWRDLTPLPVDRQQFRLGDFAYQYYAPATYAADRLHAGQLPLWGPATFGGHPFAADIQNAVFYPPRLLTVALTFGRGFPYRALEMEALAHFLLIAISTYLLARRLTRNRTGGIVAAIVFTFSSYLTGYPLLQLGILEAEAWLPLTLLLLDLASERLAQGQHRSSIGWGLGAGLLLAASWLAGSPQAALLVTYGSVAFLLFQTWPRPATVSWRLWWPRIRLLAVVGLTCVGAALIQLLPSFEFMRLSIRAGIGFEQAGGGFMPYDLLQAIFPAVGVPFAALYFGVLPVGLAIAGLIYGRAEDVSLPPTMQRAQSFWSWSALIALLLSFGKHLPVYSFAYLLVPGWGLFRQQERTVVWVVLAIALLAGYGTTWMMGPSGSSQVDAGSDEVRKRLVRRMAHVFLWAALASVGLGLIFFIGYQAGYESLWGFTSAAMFLALSLALAGLAVWSRRPVLLVIVLLVDLLTVNQGNHSTGDLATPFPSEPLLSIPSQDTGMFRVDNQDVLPPTYGFVHHFRDLGGASQLRLEGYESVRSAVPAARLWDILNVKYVLSWQEDVGAPAERLAERNDSNGKPVYLYRLAKTGPPAWLAGEVLVEFDPGKLQQKLASDDFDPTRQVLLSVKPDGMDQANACDGTVTLHEDAPEKIRLTVETKTPCILVLSELAYPGWRATLDGRSVPILRADSILRAVQVDSGVHEVIMVFRPATVYLGAVASFVTILLVLGWWVLRAAGPKTVGADALIETDTDRVRI